MANRSDSGALASRPRWDGGNLLFDFFDGAEAIPCAMSCAAIEQILSRRCFREADALAFFQTERLSIEALTRDKLRARADGACGRLTIWADDLETLPDAFGAAAAGA